MLTDIYCMRMLFKTMQHSFMLLQILNPPFFISPTSFSFFVPFFLVPSSSIPFYLHSFIFLSSHLPYTSFFLVSSFLLFALFLLLSHSSLSFLLSSLTKHEE